MTEKRFDCQIIGTGVSGFSPAGEQSAVNRNILLPEKGVIDKAPARGDLDGFKSGNELYWFAGRIREK